MGAFESTDNFEDGAFEAVNLGDDADTTGAVYGQLAGAYYGINAIRSDSVEEIAMRDQIITMADRLAKRQEPSKSLRSRARLRLMP